MKAKDAKPSFEDALTKLEAIVELRLPDVGDIEENVADVLGSDISDKVQRRKQLGDPTIASTYEYDTNHVYTFVSGNIPLW